MLRLVIVTAMFFWGCSSSGGSGDSGGAGGSEADRGIAVDMGGAGGSGGAGAMGGSGGMGGAGGSGGSGGGMEEPIDSRCPDAQAGTYLLVAFPDRVDAYRQRMFGATYFCKFLALAGNGITEASGIAFNRDGDKVFVTQSEAGTGTVYEFNTNGEFVGKVGSNVNLQGVQGLWNTFGDTFIAWSRMSQNFYELGPDGRFRQPYSPPVERGSRVEAVTDVLFLDQDSVIMTFSDRPAKLYKAPFAPDFPEDEVGPANAVAGVETEEGIKLLMTAQIGGEGNAYGVAFYAAAESGRVAPERERVLVNSTNGEFVDGIDIWALEGGLGFLLLDSNLAGTAKIVSFNTDGELQATIPLDGGGNPFQFMKASIFPDF